MIVCVPPAFVGSAVFGPFESVEAAFAFKDENQAHQRKRYLSGWYVYPWEYTVMQGGKVLSRP